MTTQRRGPKGLEDLLNAPFREARRKAATVTASTRDYTVRHEGGVWHISAKDFPAKQTFRVYRVEGDINRIPTLIAGIEALLTANGITKRTIELTL